MKAGDKVYCHTTFIGYKNIMSNNRPNGTFPIIYDSGQYYTIENIISSTSTCHKIEIKSGHLKYQNTTYWFFYYNDNDENKPYFCKYFYTLKELRKQKLLKISK